RRPGHALPPSDRAHADRALAAFLDRTRGPASWQRADRALTLHMLETHAPRFFAEAGLAGELEAARAALAGVPRALAPDPTAPPAMARVDAAYLLSDARELPSGLARSGAGPSGPARRFARPAGSASGPLTHGGALDPSELAACLRALHPLYAWLLG